MFDSHFTLSRLSVLSSLSEFKAGGNKLSSSGRPLSVVDTLATGVKHKLDLSSTFAPGLGIGLQVRAETHTR